MKSRVDKLFMTALTSPQSIDKTSVADVVAAFHDGELTLLQTLALLSSFLVVRADLGNAVPLSFLNVHLPEGTSEDWQKFLIVLLHSNAHQNALNWLMHHRELIKQQTPESSELCAIAHIFEWFPESVDLLQVSDSGRQLLQVEANEHAGRELDQIVSARAKLLVVHNIVDGQGDEMLRTYALMQAFLDSYHDVEITLFTDRPYLYDHDRVHTCTIHDTNAFAELVETDWTGIINFFDPYLASNCYNPRIQLALKRKLEKSKPPLFVLSRKDINHFVYESVMLHGQEFAEKLGVSKRPSSSNYSATAKLIKSLGLHLRHGEAQAKSGFVQCAKTVSEFETRWSQLTKLNTTEVVRPIALLNIFGGQHADKGFTAQSRARFATVLASLVEDGYEVVLFPTAEPWGDIRVLSDMLQTVDSCVRHHIRVCEPLSNRQENMRMLKYFVSFADLVVTVEGWMLHLGYATGKPYRLLVAPYSGTREWHPFLTSKNQRRWLPTSQRDSRRELLLSGDVYDSAAPPPVHYPDKTLLQCLLNLCRYMEAEFAKPVLAYWLRSEDSNIREWSLQSMACFDDSQPLLLEKLNDRNHKVRAAAANGLLRGEQSVSNQHAERLFRKLGPDWQAVLHGYELVGGCRFLDAARLASPGLAALQSCIGGDDPQMERDAKIALKTVQVHV